MNYLKLKNISFLLCVILIQISCSSDDNDDSSTDNSSAVGTYNLLELNINPGLDLNEDGTVSTNLLDELTCITGTLILNTDSSWNLTMESVAVTTITGDLFFADCIGTTNNSGVFQLAGNQVTLIDEGGSSDTYILSENTLSLTIGENLPNFQSLVYQQQ